MESATELVNTPVSKNKKHYIYPSYYSLPQPICQSVIHTDWDLRCAVRVSHTLVCCDCRDNPLDLGTPASTDHRVYAYSAASLGYSAWLASVAYRPETQFVSPPTLGQANADRDALYISKRRLKMFNTAGSGTGSL